LRAAGAQLRIFKVLVNPQYDECTEDERAAAAGMAPRTWRKHRTPGIVREAIAARRAAYVRDLIAIDKALMKKATEGSLPHILIAYERIEGWRPRGTAARTEKSPGCTTSDLLSPESRQALADILRQALQRRPAETRASTTR